ncbi:MAG: M28 family peptidase, partial [Halioglobus sp.]
EAEGRARQWAVAKLNALGFHNVRVESFQVPVWVRGSESAQIVAPSPQSLTITALGGSASTGVEGVTAEVVSFASLAALQSAPVDQVRGKIVFVDEPMARTKDGAGYGVAVAKRRLTAYEAQRLGASAALIRSVGTSSHRFAHTGQMRRVTEQGESGVPTAALSAPDADQLMRLLSRGKPVVMKVVITAQKLPPAESGNVIAEIPGSAVPDEVVLVGAHLDSWDLGTGAIDDGAGVGIVVAAAKLLMDELPRAPRRTIRVVLFGSEEVGLVGAQAYATQHATELPLHIVATESDFGAGDIWRFDTGVAEEKIAMASAIGDVLHPLGVAAGNNNATGGPDIKYLREAGVPVVGLKQNGLDYFDLHHTADDTLDKISPDSLNQNVAAYAAFLYLAAEMTGELR